MFESFDHQKVPKVLYISDKQRYIFQINRDKMCKSVDNGKIKYGFFFKYI